LRPPNINAAHITIEIIPESEVVTVVGTSDVVLVATVVVVLAVVVIRAKTPRAHNYGSIETH